jgi:nucleoid-associated protein YgaU
VVDRQRWSRVRNDAVDRHGTASTTAQPAAPAEAEASANPQRKVREEAKATVMQEQVRGALRMIRVLVRFRAVPSKPSRPLAGSVNNQPGTHTRPGAAFF